MLYDRDIFERNGRRFRFTTQHDDAMGAPWDEHDGHGIVSDWTRRAKKPGEVIIATDRDSHRFYDVEATLKSALRDGWGTADGKQRGESAEAYAARAVEEDRKRMRGWCMDFWSWIGVVVTLLDENDEDTGKSASLWGIESDAGEYLQTVAHELADEIGHDLMTAETLGEPVL